MNDLTAFLNARLDEDEAAARATSPSGQRLAWRASDEINEEGTPVHWVVSDPNPAAAAEAMGLERETGSAVAAHIARHDPARALREVGAGRALLAEHAPDARERRWCRRCRIVRDGEIRRSAIGMAYPCLTVRILASVWDDHPDYRREWAP